MINSSVSNKLPQCPKLPVRKNNSVNNKSKLFIRIEFKCLHLNESFKGNIGTVFRNDMEIKIDLASVEDFFKIKEKSSSEKSEKSSSIIMKNKIISLSSTLDTNRTTGISKIFFINFKLALALKSLSKTIKINVLLENIIKVFKDFTINESLLEVIFSPEILNILKSIIPTENEMSIINKFVNEELEVKLESELDEWLFNIYKNPEIKLLIINLLDLQKIKVELVDMSFLFDCLIEIYESLMNNENLSVFLNLILRINNQLNKETGKKEISNFDITLLDNLLDSKINGKLLLEYLLDCYLINSVDNIQTCKLIISNSEISLVNRILEQDIPIFNEEVLIAYIEKINCVKKELLSIINNTQFLKKLELILDGTLKILESIEISSEKENGIKRKFLKYFSVKSYENEKDSVKRSLTFFSNLSKKSETHILKFTGITRSKSIKSNVLENKQIYELKTSSDFKENINTDSNTSVSLGKSIPTKLHEKRVSGFISNKYKLK